MIRVLASAVRTSRSGSVPRACSKRIGGFRRSAMGPTTDGYSLASIAIESPGFQSRLSATIETPSATLLTKPISPGWTPHSRATPPRAASTCASCAARPGKPDDLSARYCSIAASWLRKAAVSPPAQTWVIPAVRWKAESGKSGSIRGHRQSSCETTAPAVVPPSITIVCPVTKLPAAEARNTAAPAISSGSPIRCSGVSLVRLR